MTIKNASQKQIMQIKRHSNEQFGVRKRIEKM